jgi:hypothetical protein
MKWEPVLPNASPEPPFLYDFKVQKPIASQKVYATGQPASLSNQPAVSCHSWVSPNGIRNSLTATIAAKAAQ